MWRPGFAFEHRRVAAVRGWQRRFWQYSPDHRGIPEHPGLVVTLIEAVAATCHGIAYQPVETQRQQIMAELDVREQNGYDLVEVSVEFEDGEVAEGVTYVASPSNPSFSGPLSNANIARRIVTAHGPSGSNREYLEALGHCLAEIGKSDEHVTRLCEVLAQQSAPEFKQGSR